MSRVVPEWVRKARKGTTGKRAGFKHGFRSGLEEKVGAQIEKITHEPPFFETFKLPYMVPEKRNFYTPDFLLPNGILVECKGIFDSTDRAKHLFVKAQFPGLDIRFVFTRSTAPIGPSSKTTLADWCKRYGYRFADKLIPEEWFRERGPDLDPRVLIKEGPFGYVKRL